MKTRQDPSAKPYYRCLSCSRFRKNCGGRPTRDYDLQSWCEYMRDVKEVVHLTNSNIAEEAGVSITTIESIMSLNRDQDIMRATARRIELVIIGPVRKHFCDMDYDGSAATERINALLAENETLKRDIVRYKAIIDMWLDKKFQEG